MADENCPLCKQEARVQSRSEDRKTFILEVECATCGNYSMTIGARDQVNNPEFDRHRATTLSAIARELSERGRPIMLCSSAYGASKEAVGIPIEEAINTLAPRSVGDSIDRALMNLARRSAHFGDAVKVDAQTDWPLLFAERPDALQFTLRHMVASGLLEEIRSHDQGGGSYALTVKGWQRTEELSRLRPASRQGFIAMWFDPQLDDAYRKGFQPAIKDAGYDPMRIDITQFNEKIDDRIIAEIRRSRFLVADVTEHRQAVYFEAGLAMGLGLPVIFTCHKDHLEGCNFDTRQYNHIVWESFEDLKEKLRNRIEATIA